MSARRSMLRSLVIVLACVTATSGVAWAFWTTTAAPGGNGASGAASMNDIPTPSASASGRTVSISWAASTLSNGVPVDGYIVSRYDGAALTQQPIGAGCAGTVTATSCAEVGVPAGQWVYSVTPVLAKNWRGQGSVKSGPVTVAGPTLALTSTRVKPGTSMTGTATAFLAGETLRYRLDSTTGLELAGTLNGSTVPAAIPASGGGSVTLTVPQATTDGTHQVYAMATPSGDAAVADIVVDGTPPPVPTLTQTPTTVSGDSATFAFTNAEPTAKEECRLDTAAFVACESPVHFGGLSAGSHTFQARASDTVGNVSGTTSYTWTVDLTIPTVSIGFPSLGGFYNDSGLTAGCGTVSTGDVCGTAEDDTAVLAVNVSLRQLSTNRYWDGLSFSSSTETWLAAGGTGDWSWAVSSGALPEGDYTFRARAGDALSGGNVGYDALTFTLDRTAPTTPTLTSAPTATSGPSASIEFTSTDPAVGFECSLDGGSWASCSSPKRYSSLTDGPHNFSVRAVDRAGNTSAATSRTWTADATSPTVSLTFPSAGSFNLTGWAAGCGTTSTGDICGTASDTGSGVGAVAVSIRRSASSGYWDGAEFAASGEAWLTATGTTSWSYLFDAGNFPADGSYTIRWRATDKVGNATTGTANVTVDMTAPSAPLIVQAPHDPSGASALFDFTATEAGTGFECRLDLGQWVTCAGPVSYSGLSPGKHTFDVRATDTAGNLSGTTTYTWAVDAGIPSVNISSPSGGRTYNDAGYNSGCGTAAGDICGTASDPQGNLASVDVSIQRESTQLYWNGTTFSSATTVHLPATGSGSWSYTFPASALAGGETYTVAARAHASAGLTAVDSVTIAFDRTPPTAPTITSGPTGTTSGSSDTLTFTAEAGARFECQLDTGTWAACTSPKTYQSLTDGQHSFAVRAVDTAGNTGASTTRTWTVDATAPSVSITFPATGGRYNDARYEAGCLTATGDICGTASDTPGGVAKVEVSLQRASSELYLSGNTFTSATPTWTTATGTTAWNYPLAASTFPAGDTYTVSVRATDGLGNARTTTRPFVIDRTKPTASGFSTANVNVARKVEPRDTFTLTYSESIDPSSIITGWIGTTTQNVVIRATGSGGSKDRLTIYNATNTTLLPLGTVNLNRTDYVSGATTFGLTGTPSTITMTGSGLTLALGAPSRTTSTAAAAANVTWTPDAAVLDLAGNTAATNPYTETDSDGDF